MQSLVFDSNLPSGPSPPYAAITDGQNVTVSLRGDCSRPGSFPGVPGCVPLLYAWLDPNVGYTSGNTPAHVAAQAAYSCVLISTPPNEKFSISVQNSSLLIQNSSLVIHVILHPTEYTHATKVTNSPQ